MGYFFLGKKSLLLMAGSLIGTMTALGSEQATRKSRPVIVGALKEGYAFKEYVAGKLAKLKEDAEDMAAEAAYEYQSEAEASASLAKREQDLLEKIESIVGQKRSAMHSETKEASS